jgi:large subunit ribosomal protein L34e
MVKKVKVRTPTGRVVIRAKKEKVGIPRCGECGKPLHGIPREIQSRIRDLPKTKKRPERPYGGYLCSSCTRELIRERVRKQFEPPK